VLQRIEGERWRVVELAQQLYRQWFDEELRAIGAAA
jgi:hypothetical protein